MLSVGLLFACQGDLAGQAPQIEVPLAYLGQQQVQKQGAELFRRHCLECHGTFREGRTRRTTDFTPPAPDFLDSAYAARDPAYLFWRISEGKRVEPFFSQGSVMPAFGPYFTEQQRWQLVAYLRFRAGSRTQ